MLAADLISNAEWDDYLVAVVGIIAAVTTLAALAHKPPLLQLFRAIGWVFGRLIGEPIAAWWAKVYEAQARPLIREEVERAVEPIRSEQAAVAADLRAHMASEATERAELLGIVHEHVDEDRAAFDEIREWRAATDVALSNIQNAGAPHVT